MGALAKSPRVARVDFQILPLDTSQKAQKLPVRKRRFSGRNTMPTSRRTLLKTSAAAAAAFTFDWTRAQAQAETVRIGVIYDLTGPFAAGGSVASSIGAQI